jgi:signal peptidase I
MKKIIIDIILIITILFLGITIYKKINNKDLSIFGYSFSIVLTSSMDATLNTDNNNVIEQPIIKKGDFIITKNIDLNDVKVGDVILYNTTLQNNLNLGITKIIHKVIAVNYDENSNKYLTTKGTANELADTEKVKNVSGIFIYTNSFLGKVFSFLMNPINLVFLLIIIIGLNISIKQINNIIKTVNSKPK